MIEEKIHKIVEDWFLMEPALFVIWCTHKLIKNEKLAVPMRSGRQIIEFNPEMMKDWNEIEIAERLRYEVMRILLGHPYMRQPFKARKGILGLASDITLKSLYKDTSTLPVPSDLIYEEGKCFEEYYALVKKYVEQKETETYSPPYEIDGGLLDDGGGGLDDEADMGGDTSEIENMMRPYTEAAELWEEDQLMQESIREKIEQVKRMNQWGSLPGKVVDEILASTIVRIDYRQILSMFRASVLSSSRKLTRMLPSRRYGFEYMGSKRDFTTELLVAIDVSGSVTNEGISQALSIINRFFKYGVENIDVIQFDYGLQGEKMTIKKALKDKFKVQGRGGTDFQAPIDLFLKDGYDGLIMITDGFAAVPEVPKVFRGNILWLIYENEWFDISRKQGLNKELSWIKDFPRSRYTVLPPV
jgi:predicted metal-dependent peptidase